jgi:type III secretion system needle length determinant
MNIGTTASPASSQPAALDALLPQAGAPAGAEGVSAFLDMLGLLNGAAVPQEELDAAPEETDADEAAADEAPAMPAMAPAPNPFVMAMPLPVSPVDAAPAEPAEADGATESAPLDVAGVAPDAPRRAPLPQAALPVPVAVDPAMRPVRAEPAASAEEPAAAAPVRAAAVAPAEQGKATEFHLDDTRAPVAAAASRPQAADDGLPAVKLSPTTPAQWRQPLAEALGDRLQLNLQRGSDQAVIRLDPPQLGRIEIAIRHEAGSLQVHLSATHGEVVRQLNTIGDSLRQDLGQRQYGDVSVVVSDAGAMGRDADGRSRGRQPQQENTDPNRALAEAEVGLAKAFRLGDNTSETR